MVGFDFETAKPVPNRFDFDSAVPINTPEKRSVYMEATNEVVDMPEGTLDTIFRIAGGGYDKGNQGLELNNLYLRELFGEEPTPQMRERATLLREQLSKEIKTDGYHQEMLRAVSEQTPQLMTMAGKVLERSAQGAGIFAGGAFVAGQLGPQVGLPEEIVTVPTAAIIGGKGGARLGFLEHSFLQNAAEAYGEFSNFTDKTGNRIDPDLARFGAFFVGTANAGLDVIPLKLFEKLLGGNKFVGALSGSGKKSIKIPGTGEAARKIFMDYVNLVSGETTTEALQEGIKGGSGEFLKLLSDQDFESKTAAEIFENMVAAGDEALKVSIPLAGVPTVGRVGIEAKKAQTRKKERIETEQQLKALEDAVGEVSSEGIEGVAPSEVTAAVGRKMIKGDTLTAKEAPIAEDILFEAKIRLAQAENKPIQQIQEQQKALQQKEIQRVENEIEQVVDDVLVEIFNLQQSKTEIDSELKTLLEDKASLLRQRGKTSTTEDLEVIDNSLLEINKELRARDIELDTRGRLTELRKTVSRNIQADRTIQRAAKRADKRIAELENKQAKIEAKPPKLLADKLKTFKSGLRKGKTLQKAETKDVQNALIQIIDDSGIDAKDKAKFTKAIKNTQTFEQFDKRINEFTKRLGVLEEKARTRAAKSKIKKLLNRKTIGKKTQSGKKVGKFTPQIQRTLDLLKDNISKKPEAAQAELEQRLETGKIPSPEQALVNKALAIASKDDKLTATDLENFANELETLIQEGRTQNKVTGLARRDAIAELQLQAATELKKGDDVNLIDETTFKRRIARGAMNARAFVDGWLYGWYDIPDIVLGGNQQLVEKLRVGKNVSQEKGIVRSMTTKLEEAGMSAFGFDTRRQFLKQMEADAQVIDLGIIPDANGKDKRWQFTKQEMRKLWMEAQDPSLQDTLFSEHGNAYTNQIMNAINEQLSVEDRAFARAQMDIYKGFYNEVNKVYSRVYQVDLPFNETYSPISRRIDAEFDTDAFLKDVNYRRSVAPGSLKSRVQNIRALRTQSDIGVFQRHITEMAHFISFAEKIQEINGVFGNAGIRELIDKRYGRSMLRIIDDYIQVLTRGGAERATVLGQVINTLNRNFAVSVLGGKVALAAKQLTSFVAFADSIPITSFSVGVADFAKNPAKAIKILSESELMKARGASPERDIAAVGKAIDWKLLQKKQKFDDIMLIPTKLGDRGAIYVGGWALYRHHRKQGLSHKQALEKFEELVATTQQSGDPDQLSLVQASSPFVRAFTMFLSAPTAYLRAEIRAIRHFSRGQLSKTQFAKKIALYHFVLPTLFQFVASGFEWDKDKQLLAASLGPVNGFVIFGDALQRAVGSAFGQNYFAGEPNFASWAIDLTKGTVDAITAADFEDVMEAMKDIAEGVGTGAGLPVDATEGIIEGVDLIDKGETEKGTLRILGWPKSAIKDKESTGSGFFK